MKIYRKLKRGERADIATMMYFIPSNVKTRVYPNDKIKMANLSSKGIKPNRETHGYTLLRWGKTYRDETITSYRENIQNGLMTKAELLEWIPPRFRGWLWEKIKDVPYDIKHEASDVWISMYRNGDYHKTVDIATVI